MEQAVWFAESRKMSRPYFLLDTVPKRVGNQAEEGYKDFIIRTVTILSVDSIDGRTVFSLERVERIPRKPRNVNIANN